MSSTIAVLTLLAYSAFVASRTLQRRQIPELVGFLIAGALFGPSALGLLDEGDLASLKPVTSVALAVLMFLLAERLTVRALRVSRSAVAAAALSYAIAGAAVYAVCRALEASTTTSLLLAVLAGAGAPMTVASVARSLGSDDATASALVGAHVVCDTLAAVAFAAVLPVVDLLDATVDTTPSQAVLQFLRFGLGAVALGVLLGLAVRWTSRGVVLQGDLLVLVLVHVLVMATVSGLLDLSLPLAAFAMGATVASGPARSSRHAFLSVRPLEPALYLIFFALAGASVHVRELPALGALGAAYVAARVVGKLVGGLAGGLIGGLDGRRALRLGLDLLPQGGVAVGLAVLASESLVGATEASTVVLGSVVLFELLGPLLVARHLRSADDHHDPSEVRSERALAAPSVAS